MQTSKLFFCRCARCCEDSEAARSVPCPGCHPRIPSEGDAEPTAFSLDVALGQVAVHYAAPLSSELGAAWRCQRCRRTWTAEAVLPGPPDGRLSGRAWERSVEHRVLSLDRRWTAQDMEGVGRTQASVAEALLSSAHELY